MPQSTFQQAYGLGTVQVALSFRGNGTNPITTNAQIRQGLAGIVFEVLRTAAGVYTVTFNQKMGRLVFGTSGIETAAASSFIPSFSYNTTDEKTLTIRTADAAGAPADPVAGSRIGFFGIFSPRTDLRDKE